MYVLDTIFKDFQTLVKSIVIKYDTEAKKHETLETRRSSDEYMAAYFKEDNFRSYVSYPAEVLIRAGVATNENDARPYVENKNMIPVVRRARVLEEQRKYVISKYEEKNNYYRMLAGMPDVDDYAFVFVDDETALELSIDPLIPIHLLTKDDIIKLERIGRMEGIIAENPEKKYLGYLGNNAIEIARARRAKNFSVLRMTNDITETFNEEFDNIYDQCREYFMSTIYNKAFGKSYDLYDNFIAMSIMIFTMQRIVSNAFKYGIENDFYDIGSIQMLFNAYNVPFIASLPIAYQRILVRNLNNLLRYKATDKVLYDICSLLGFERIQIYKYFLVKQHKLDINNEPVFLYKEVDNGDGTTSIVEDREKMYSLFFQSVELNERNQALALVNSTNTLDYDQVVVDDPYWWDDDQELKDYLYESEFNFIETKFLSMNIMYKMTEMLFEVIYVFRMLLDKKSELKTVTIELPKLFSKKEVNLFEVTVFMCALLSKKNGMRGEIISTPSKSLSILGFNFHQDFNTIRKYIRDNPNLIDSEILQYLQNLRIYTPEDVNRLFVNIRELNDFLVRKMAEAKHPDEYRAYQKLFKALLVTQESTELFKKNDGTVAETFLEYLWDHDVELANFVEDAEMDRIGEYIDHILTRINMLITSLQHLYIINESNSVLLNAAITLVRFFKSYTTDLTSFNIFYLMDSRYFNMVKLMGVIRSLEANMTLVDDSMMLAYKDNIRYNASLSKKDILDLINSTSFMALNKHSDRQTIEEVVKYHSDILYKAKLALQHRPTIVKEMTFKHFFTLHDRAKYSALIAHQDAMEIRDMLKVRETEIDYRLQMILQEKAHIIKELLERHLLELDDRFSISSLNELREVLQLLDQKRTVDVNMYPTFKYLLAERTDWLITIRFSDLMSLDDSYIIQILHTFKDPLFMEDRVGTTSHLTLITHMLRFYTDSIRLIESNLPQRDSLLMTDTIRITYEN